MGLAQKHQSIFAEQEHTLGPLFVLELAKRQKITRGEFSFAINNREPDDSFVDFGDPVASRVKGGDLSSLVELQFNEDFYWSTAWQGIKFGSDSAGFAIEEELQYTIFDTGTAHMFLPQSIYERVMSHLVSQAGNANVFRVEGVTFLECYLELDFPPVWFMFDQHWIQVSPADYFYDVSGDGSLCILLFLQNTYDFFIAGQPIMKGYYVDHNMRTSTVSFAPLAGSKNAALEAGEVPTQQLKIAKDKKAIWTVLAVVAYFTASILIYNYAFNPWLLFTFTPWFEETFGVTLPQFYINLLGRVLFFLLLILVFYYILLPLIGVETDGVSLVGVIAGLIV